MNVISATAARRSETPNGVMTTLASPKQGGTETSLWRVELHPGAAGPSHSFDVQQIWTVLAGAASLDVDGVGHSLAPGDTVILDAGVVRQFTADADLGFVAIATGPGGARVSGADGQDLGIPPWTV